MNAMIRTVACGLTLSVVACNAWAQAQDKPPGYPLRSFDVRKTFEPDVASSTPPYVLLAHPNVSATSIKEKIALSLPDRPTIGEQGVTKSKG